ncbi:MAG: lactate dehydrogenase [Nitrosopumilus sp.]|nr:lactate dehydrogenase [Nitrosopumilus sp.]
MISIIGSGRVGSAIGFLAASHSVDDVVLINDHRNKAVGEELDISNAIPEDSPFSVVGTDDISKIKDSKVVVIAANNGKIKTGRMDLLKGNLEMTRDFAKSIQKYAQDAKILVITNPVDIITYFVQKESELPKENVIGLGSNLDSSRLRYILAKELDVKQSDIHDSLVLGEHGDTMVPILSRVKYGQKLISESLNVIQKEKITNDLKQYWAKIVAMKDVASVFGISKIAFDVIDSILKENELSMPASVLLEGEYGISDVCLGVPLVIGKNETKIQEIELEKSEYDLLQTSAKFLRNQIMNC